MSIKTEKRLTAICSSDELTIREIGERSVTIIPKMLNEIEKFDLEVVGPTIFISYGRTGDLEKVFRHEICIPIKDSNDYMGEFEIKEIKEVKCLHGKFNGTLLDVLTNGINELLEKKQLQELNLTGEMREIYHVWENAESSNNEIEIQFVLD